MRLILTLAAVLFASAVAAQTLDSMRTRNDCLQFLEKAVDDGGLIINTICRQADGEYLNYREWWRDRNMARSVYSGMTDAEVKKRKALAEGLSGQLNEPVR